MALPLPRVVADVEAGGPLVTSMRGMNALNQGLLDTSIKGVQAKYAPITTLGEAASKLAYANLMGPQFLAKLMGNPDILANMSPEQRNAAQQLIYRAGSGQGTGNALLSNPALSQLNNAPASNESLLGKIVRNVKNAFGFNETMPAVAANPFASQDYIPQQSSNAFVPQSGVQGIGENSGMSYDANGNNVRANANEMPEAAQPIQINNGNANDKYYENTARGEGIKEEGKELGKQRAADIKDLNADYEQAISAKIPINHLLDIVKNPTFQNLRRYKGFQNFQLNAKANFGTPEEQKLIGEFQTNATKAVAEAVNGFRGRILDKEVTMANQMKISPHDSINVMIGKLPSIAAFNEIIEQRSKLAADLMDQYHINKGKALQIADQKINGEAIRNRIKNDLERSQMITLRDPKTGEIVTLSVQEAKAGGFKGA
jgi:hypothetical protein